MTRVGRFLGRSRIDELPQFWNVLTGGMSLIAPRPERPTFVRGPKERIPYYALRFAVKPGLSGWARVMCRQGATEEDAKEMPQYELYAIQKMTPMLYLLDLIQADIRRPQAKRATLLHPDSPTGSVIDA